MTAAPERAMLAMGDREWPVRVIRHPRATRYRLAFDPVARELKLTLPRRAAVGRALAWAAEQGDWVAAADARAAPVVAVGDGAVLPVEGEPHRVAWAADAPRGVRRSDGLLLVGGPHDAVGRRLQRWLREQALTLLDAESRAIAARIGRTPARVGIADPRSRWGSCSSDGTLRYSWRLFLAPPVVRQATVAHEVAHMVHMDHGARFHALVDELAGAEDVRTARDWLRRHGSGLHRYRFG